MSARPRAGSFGSDERCLYETCSFLVRLGSFAAPIAVPRHPVIGKVAWECLGINRNFWELLARMIAAKFKFSRYCVYILIFSVVNTICCVTNLGDFLPTFSHLPRQTTPIWASCHCESAANRGPVLSGAAFPMNAQTGRRCHFRGCATSERAILVGVEGALTAFVHRNDGRFRIIVIG